MLLHWSVPPPNNFWRLSWSPVSSFSKQEKFPQAINNDRSVKRLWMPAEKVLWKLFIIIIISLLLLLRGVWLYSLVTPVSWVMFTIIPSRGKSTTPSCVIQQKQGCLRLSEPLLPTPSVIFDHRLRIVIIIIIGPFRFLSLLRMCNEIHENRHGSWQKHSPPCILIPTLYRANQKLRLGNQSIMVLVI